MENTTSTDLNKALRDLSSSSFGYKRHAAASVLGRMPESNEEIVRALATAVALDDDADVRNAALQALQSPAHQAFLKDRPDFIREAMKLAVEGREKEEQQEGERIKAEYLRRRTQERLYYLILIGTIIASFILFAVGVIQEWLDMSTIRTWQVIFIAFVIFIFSKSWRNWRCPACESWLGGFTAAINPLWSSNFIHCPHCGKRLL